MGQTFAALEAKHREFIAAQRIFFVASAAPTGRVNLSPKGMASFAVLDDKRVAYLDCTGSGSETRAHLLADPGARLTIMFVAFEGDPVILRLYGRGASHLRGGAEYAALLPHFEEMPGARQIVTLEVDLVQTSCGMSAPLFAYKGERKALIRHWTRQGIEGLRKYWRKKNLTSLDGLPTHFDPDAMAPPAARS